MKKNSELLIKALDKCEMIMCYFSHFITNEWIYDTFNMYQLKARLSEEDLQTYLIDIADLDWKKYFPNFAYGIQNFLLKEEVEPPFLDRVSLISTRPRFLGDLMWVYYHGKPQPTKDPNQIK
mmetsp:Transcript_35337/g.40837  ORF Transcript_35337/g.40837 Transcript_35337/m.40837 type:complete len:122 (-) Transcript_35337:371-736(-)